MEKKIKVYIYDFDGIPEKFYPSLYNKAYGEKIENVYKLDLYEVLYLMEIGRVEAFFGNKKLDFKDVLEIGKKWQERFWSKYLVYRDLRKRGLFPKTAFKYGMDFRVYDKTPGPKTPNRIHSKYLVKVLHEEDKISLKDFSLWNRIANSVNKELVIAVVDREGDITYYKSEWVKL